jgi:hypothetical protein
VISILGGEEWDPRIKRKRRISYKHHPKVRLIRKRTAGARRREQRRGIGLRNMLRRRDQIHDVGTGTQQEWDKGVSRKQHGPIRELTLSNEEACLVWGGGSDVL